MVSGACSDLVTDQPGIALHPGLVHIKAKQTKKSKISSSLIGISAGQIVRIPKIILLAR